MSGPNYPGRESEQPDSADGSSDELQPVEEVDESGEHAVADHTGETDIYSRAYSAPESEHFSSGPYVPADFRLYDYDAYDVSSDADDEHAAPRWPWVVGIVAIAAAVALVVSVSLLVAQTDTSKLANPGSTTAAAPQQDEITTTTPPPLPSSTPPPPPTSTEIPTATETQTVTVTPAPPPPPATSTAAPPPPATSTAAPPPATSTAAAPPPPTTTTLAAPRQVTYSVTGTKAPGDIISVTYVDASGRRRTQQNVYIPWSMTVTPISQSDVGSVEAFSLFHVSRLNCSIITSDGTVLSSNTSDQPQTSC
ncbi:MAG: hypothetical protein JO236_11680 [Mycobacterium sp.]|uniref:MmpS family transport accessory protein n=1 Tax=Mycobacterium sp. TaxID=1785 RepID=UPI001EC2FE93|nr:MmpS family transport accessory protein [Mycobacterium sp.]MBW0018188.1 hypothetical protein [Mycobacterium sp.]